MAFTVTLDAYGNPIPGGEILDTDTVIFASVATLRAATGLFSSSFIYTTLGYRTAGDGGSAGYRWNPLSTATDDGVLVIKNAYNFVGRFEYFNRDPQKLFSAACCGPALADNTRTVSFDPTNTVAMGTEFFRVTKILRNAGYSGISFPDGTYKCSGAEQVGVSTLPGVGFDIIRQSGACFAGDPATTTATSQPISCCAYGEGAESPTSIIAAGYNSRYWTEVIQGSGSRTCNGVANIVGLAVGDTVVVRYGADNTDGDGSCFCYTMAKIVSITPTTGTAGNVLLDTGAPEPIPVAPYNSHRQYNKHDLVKITGFQDNTRFIGGRWNDMFIALVGARDTYSDGEWDNCKTFAINTLFCSGLRVPHMRIRNATGSTSVPANIITLAKAYDSHFGRIIVDNLYPVGAVSCNFFDEEAVCRGTRIDSISVNYNANNVGAIVLIGQTPGQTNLISVGMLHIAGGTAGLTVCRNCKIDTLDIHGDGTSINLFIRGDQAGAIYWRGQVYTSVRDFVGILPAPASSTKTFTVPWHGLTRYLRLKIASMTGVTSVHVSGDGFSATDYDVTANMIANKWVDINQAAIMSVATGNFLGNNACSVRVVTSGASPAGNVIEIAHSCLLVDLMLSDLVGATYGTDTSTPIYVTGDGAPSANAAFIGQEYLDRTGGVWYKAKNTGTGASDWV